MLRSILRDCYIEAYYYKNWNTKMYSNTLYYSFNEYLDYISEEFNEKYNSIVLTYNSKEHVLNNIEMSLKFITLHLSSSELPTTIIIHPSYLDKI
ncbi:hypothetical protein RaK2_00395 [Klebsiella phage vB_KleM_RaK2]|uniref:Uncharacterized protein n=1 Tax=Klebsiella phage vB_KleM_RaK2 TaxID=1147094 RepID=H6X4K2_9CAUD|nr:hypothetical protein F403_gp140 [Klebsiella phage vB_KleM_RaK2]AFA44668.1 hypothetical protein RaK2_00395 [Klebsiella phage vB_KleM_RaK2]